MPSTKTGERYRPLKSNLRSVTLKFDHLLKKQDFYTIPRETPVLIQYIFVKLPKPRTKIRINEP